MFFKILILIIVIFGIYYIISNRNKNKKKQHSKDTHKISGETMVECSKCSVFVSANEAIIKDGKYFCSKECANVGA